jgi:hypothetical protein
MTYKQNVNAKMIPVETIPGIREGGIKKSGRGSEFKEKIIYIYIYYYIYIYV